MNWTPGGGFDEFKNKLTPEEQIVIDNFTEGLDESIYCAMCTNSMANDRGCDGNCKVDKAMYKKVMDNISIHLSLATHGEYVYKWRNREITSPFSDDIG